MIKLSAVDNIPWSRCDCERKEIEEETLFLPLTSVTILIFHKEFSFFLSINLIAVNYNSLGIPYPQSHSMLSSLRIIHYRVVN